MFSYESFNLKCATHHIRMAIYLYVVVLRMLQLLCCYRLKCHSAKSKKKKNVAISILLYVKKMSLC